MPYSGSSNMKNLYTSSSTKISLHADVRNRLSDMMYFFGYTFDGPSLHRHCCVLDHPFNKDIKRKSAVIDKYKELLLQEDVVLKSMTSQYVSEVHSSNSRQSLAWNIKNHAWIIPYR